VEKSWRSAKNDSWTVYHLKYVFWNNEFIWVWELNSLYKPK